jgi:hypothetical protein
MVPRLFLKLKKFSVPLSHSARVVRPWDETRQRSHQMFEIIAIAAVVLDLFKPFESHDTAEFTVPPQGDATPVTWLTHGPANLMAKLEQIFVDLDTRIGKAF